MTDRETYSVQPVEHGMWAVFRGSQRASVGQLSEAYATDVMRAMVAAGKAVVASENMTMRERVARAICKGTGRDPDACTEGTRNIEGAWLQCFQRAWQQHLGSADAAIAIMGRTAEDEQVYVRYEAWWPDGAMFFDGTDKAELDFLLQAMFHDDGSYHGIKVERLTRQPLSIINDTGDHVGAAAGAKGGEHE